MLDEIKKIYSHADNDLNSDDDCSEYGDSKDDSDDDEGDLRRLSKSDLIDQIKVMKMKIKELRKSNETSRDEKQRENKQHAEFFKQFDQIAKGISMHVSVYGSKISGDLGIFICMVNIIEDYTGNTT